MYLKTFSVTVLSNMDFWSMQNKTSDLISENVSLSKMNMQDKRHILPKKTNHRNHSMCAGNRDCVSHTNNFLIYTLLKVFAYVICLEDFKSLPGLPVRWQFPSSGKTKGNCKKFQWIYKSGKVSSLPPKWPTLFIHGALIWDGRFVSFC